MELIPKEWSNRILEDYLCRVTTRSQLIYWIIIMLIIIVLVSLPLINVDVAIRSNGFFQSDIERQPIMSPCDGKVIYTAIMAGNSVKKGDTLIIMGSDALAAERASIEQRIYENYSAIKDLKALLAVRLINTRLSSANLGTQRYLAEYTSLSRLIELEAQSYYKIMSEYQRKKKLYDQKIISDADYEVSYFNFRSEEESLLQVVAQNLAKWELDLAERRNDSIILQAELQRCNEEKGNRILVAPINGEILKSRDIQAGTFLYGNQQIAELSPEGNLVGICYVSPRDIGMVKTGLKVLIQVDALKYTEWGLLEARITDISDDLILDEAQSAYFRIKCQPERSYLCLRNGIVTELKKGMTFNARIVITERTLFNLLFDRVDDWLNPYMN